MTKKYWLFGGIILLILYGALSSILYFFASSGCAGAFICFPLWSLPTLLPVAIYQRIFPLDPNAGPIELFLIGAIFYFLIGTLFGFIYGKIKKRNL